MAVTTLIEKVEEIEGGKGYWFIRTESGKYFETFYENQFIAIGWNEISLENLSRMPPSAIKEKIGTIKSENIEPDTAKGKGKITAIYNKLRKFENLRKGDLIIIPSYSSSRLAFGTIQDSKIYVETGDLNGCEFYKRKKVKWLTIENLKDLDSVFYKLIVSRHAMSDVKRYEDYIDNVTNTLYLKNGFAHYVLYINTREDININSLLNLMASVKTLNEQINSFFDLNEDVDSSSIRLNLQSPGKIELKIRKGITLAILGAVLALAVVPDMENKISDEEKTELNSFIEVNQDTISKINKAIIDLEIDREKINSYQ